ncbi:MAG TPA: hypothetical protein VNY73_01700, partial [Bacteroidia bacterium]|nr:hypothetical protein [Bacteroidia bacterium]
IIKCKITDILDDKVFYKLLSGDDMTKEIKKSEIDLIKYADGKTEDYSAVKEEKSSVTGSSGGGEKFDRNSEEFVNYANSIAKQVGESLLRECAGKYDNAFTSVYFDACFKDPFTSEITIPIRVSYIKGAEQKERFIKGMIKIKKDGAKEWIFQDSQNIVFTGCAKKYVFK